MAKWNNLKDAIKTAIATNGNQEITGALLQSALLNIISSVGENATFAGIATPDTNPGTPDGPVFYLATSAGIYSNFSRIEVTDGQVVILEWNASKWDKIITELTTKDSVLSSVFGAKATTLKNAYINTNVSVGEEVVLTPVSNVSYEYAIVDCNYGDRFIINGKGSFSARLYCFIDANNRVVEVASSNLTMSGSITAPKGSSKLIVNFNIYYEHALYLPSEAVVPSLINTVNELSKVKNGVFDIVGYTNKITGKLDTSGKSYRTTPLLKLGTNVVVTGWSGISNNAALCLCYDSDGRYLGYINAETNGVVTRYAIPSNSFILGTTYVRFNRQSGQEIYLEGVEIVPSLIYIEDMMKMVPLNMEIPKVVDNLESSSIKDALSANQGRKLNIEKVSYSDIVDTLGDSAKPMSQRGITKIISEAYSTNGIEGFASSLDKLNAIHPNGAKGVFVTVEDNKWRYWDGDKWAIGGNYSSYITSNSITDANADIKLGLTNYLGNSQNIHPKVLYFPSKLFGYKFWMAYTPYPSGNIEHENPCIAVSDDGYNWKTPGSIQNPLTNKPDGAGNYNSDTHLVFNHDTNQLECWYRPVINNADSIVRKVSSDGITWSSEQIVVPAPAGMLSPAIIYENGIYKIWYCASGKIYYREYSNGVLSNPTQLPISLGDIQAWHIDVINDGLDTIMVFCGYLPGGNNNTADLYVVTEKNGYYSSPEMCLHRGLYPGMIDSTAIYRACLVKIDNIYWVYYSCIDSDSARSIAISKGLSPLALKGQKREPRVLSITEPTTLENFNISQYTGISYSGNGELTVKSLVGGRLGDIFTIVLHSSLASVRLVHSDGLYLGGEDIVVNIKDVSCSLVIIGDTRARILR